MCTTEKNKRWGLMPGWQGARVSAHGGVCSVPTAKAPPHWGAQPPWEGIPLLHFYVWLLQSPEDRSGPQAPRMRRSKASSKFGSSA